MNYERHEGSEISCGYAFASEVENALQWAADFIVGMMSPCCVLLDETDNLASQVIREKWIEKVQLSGRVYAMEYDEFIELVDAVSHPDHQPSILSGRYQKGTIPVMVLANENVMNYELDSRSVFCAMN